MRWVGIKDGLRRRAYYVVQKLTKRGIDAGFERELRAQADEYLATCLKAGRTARTVNEIRIEDLNLDDHRRYSLFRDDIYSRFAVSENGPETDQFGRKGKWVPRGCKVYFDRLTEDFVKVFDEYYCLRGEGRFLPDALNRGLYDFLCPNLSYVILSEAGTMRGYGIRKGRQLTPYEFERYVGKSLKELICILTERTGLYLNDLIYHNTIVSDGRLSLIDLESILPVEWFGEDTDFARRHLSDVDIGRPIQRDWCSPKWYAKFLMTLKEKKMRANPTANGWRRY